MRITNKTNKTRKHDDDILPYLDLKTPLQMFAESAKSEFSKSFTQTKIEDLEQMISNQTAARNFQSISNQINNLQTSEGSFSQNKCGK